MNKLQQHTSGGGENRVNNFEWFLQRSPRRNVWSLEGLNECGYAQTCRKARIYNHAYVPGIILCVLIVSLGEVARMLGEGGGVYEGVSS